jgi:hypothetical protein
MFSKSHRIDKNLLCFTFKNVTNFQGQIQDFRMEGVRLSVADPEEANHQIKRASSSSIMGDNGKFYIAIGITNKKPLLLYFFKNPEVVKHHCFLYSAL